MIIGLFHCAARRKFAG